MPSTTFLGGFFVRMLSGFLPGKGDLPLEEVDVWEDERTGPEGTLAFCARREGFLCVIADGSTFFRCDVTDDPREISSNTAPISADPLAFDPLTGISGGGGALSKVGRGGGGGGGAEPDDCGGGDLDDDCLDCIS